MFGIGDQLRGCDHKADGIRKSPKPKWCQPIWTANRIAKQKVGRHRRILRWILCQGRGSWAGDWLLRQAAGWKLRSQEGGEDPRTSLGWEMTNSTYYMQLENQTVDWWGRENRTGIWAKNNVYWGKLAKANKKKMDSIVVTVSHQLYNMAIEQMRAKLSQYLAHNSHSNSLFLFSFLNFSLILK